VKLEILMAELMVVYLVDWKVEKLAETKVGQLAAM
jgi:hypothetical protein